MSGLKSEVWSLQPLSKRAKPESEWGNSASATLTGAEHQQETHLVEGALAIRHGLIRSVEIAAGEPCVTATWDDRIHAVDALIVKIISTRYVSDDRRAI